jgi:hypothetical protein
MNQYALSEPCTCTVFSHRYSDGLSRSGVSEDPQSLSVRETGRCKDDQWPYVPTRH